MKDGSSLESPREQPKRRRGRPPGNRKNVAGKRTNSARPIQNDAADQIPPGSLDASATYIDDVRQEERLAYELGEEHLTPFSILLRKLLRRDRSEIIRVARESGVSENTIYRWMNGSSEPRLAHLQRLLEIFSDQRESLAHAITQTFGNLPEAVPINVRDVPKSMYIQALETLATASDAETRCRQIMQQTFEHGLRHLDGERQGVAMTFAKLMPPHTDGIHSLREMLMIGTRPWPHSVEGRIYLGSTTLAGTAVELQRVQFWNSADGDGRAQVEIDQFEQSACAIPVMRDNLIGGVLIVSSTQSRFFHDPMAYQASREYALLLGIALTDQDFYPHGLLRLRPMPGLQWQRRRIAQIYNDRILACARANRMSRREAEMQVQCELEQEFEEEARALLEQTGSHVSS